MRLETKRLMLRTPRLSDWKDYVEGIGDIDVSAFLLLVPYPYKKKDAIAWIKDCQRLARKKNPKAYRFAIELKSEKKIIGGSDLAHINRYFGTAETGSWIARKYWRKGYITEAKIAINDFAFNKLKLRKLWSPVFASNKRSNNMIKKFGYKLEGTLRKDVRSKATGKLHDIGMYGMFKKEWKRVRPKLVKEIKEL